jgi:CHAD domain-containing protein
VYAILSFMITKPGYHLKQQAPGESFLSVYYEIRDELTGFCRSADKTVEESTHQVRKKLKLLRAFAKLIKAYHPKEFYNKTNIFLRDWARDFSSLRDAHVRRCLISIFESDDHFLSFRNLLKEIQSANNIVIEQLEAEFLDEKHRFEQLADHFESHHGLENYFNQSETNPGLLADGYLESFEASRKAFLSGIMSHHPEAFHEWRKRLKDFQYQTELLADGEENQAASFYPELVLLCETLGKINDDFMIMEWVLIQRHQVTNADLIPAFLEEMKQNTNTLQSMAEKKGKQFYTDASEELKNTIRSITGL